MIVMRTEPVGVDVTCPHSLDIFCAFWPFQQATDIAIRLEPISIKLEIALRLEAVAVSFASSAAADLANFGGSLPDGNPPASEKPCGADEDPRNHFGTCWNQRY